MKVKDFIAEIETFTLNGDELGHLGDFTTYIDKFEQIEDADGRTKMIEKTKKLGYLGEFSFANELIAKDDADELTILAGTVLQIEGVAN